MQSNYCCFSFFKNNFFLFSSLLVVDFLSFLPYGIPINYFPEVATKFGLTKTMIGIIFGMYPLFSLIFSLVFVKMLKAWDKKWIVLMSQIFLGGGTILFGFSSFIPSLFLFIFVAMLGRAMQGLSNGIFLTAVYAYVPEYWPDETDQRLGGLEIADIFGVGMGPIVGTMLISLGYIWIYVIPSIIIIVLGGIISFFALPTKEIVSSNKYQDLNGKEEERLSILKSFWNKPILYTFFSQVFTFGSFMLIAPGFELKVIEKGKDSKIASVIYFCYPFGYMLGCFLFVIFKTENRRGSISFGIFFSMIGLFLLGMDEIFSMGNTLSLTLMAIGLFISGLAVTRILIPNISETISILKKLFPEYSEDNFIHMASGFFSAGFFLAEFEGVLLGGILSDYFGFSYCCLTYSFLLLIFFLLFCFNYKAYQDFVKFIWPENEPKLPELSYQNQNEAKEIFLIKS